MSGDPTFYLRHRFFRFTVASHIFLKKHFPLPALGIHYFPKKTAFPKIFPDRKKTEKTEKTESDREMSGDPTFYLRHRFFRFFRFTVASDIFLKKHFPLPALGIHYFPKKTAFPKIFPAIYFKLLSLKTGFFQRAVAFFL